MSCSDNAYGCDPRIQRFKQEEKDRKAAQKKAKQEAARAREEEEEAKRREVELEAQRKKEEEERISKEKVHVHPLNYPPTLPLLNSGRHLAECHWW